MERQKYLIDTNVIIDYLGKKLPPSGMEFVNEIVNVIPNISIISKIEVLGFNAAGDHYELLLDFMYDASIFDLTNNVVDLCIDIRKKSKTKLPDVIIAATAIANGFTLVSHNVSDFKKIPNLRVVDAHRPK